MIGGNISPVSYDNSFIQSSFGGVPAPSGIGTQKGH